MVQKVLLAGVGPSGLISLPWFVWLKAKRDRDWAVPCHPMPLSRGNLAHGLGTHTTAFYVWCLRAGWGLGLFMGITNLVICTEFAFKMISLPLVNPNNRSEWWGHSKFYAWAEKSSRISWPCSKQRQMRQAFPLLMDQIIQGRMIAREGHYRFIMAQKTEKTLHYVRPKNCRVLKQRLWLGMVERERIFFPQVGGMYGIKTCYLDRNSAVSLLVFFVEEILISVYSYLISQKSLRQTKGSFIRVGVI